MLYSDEEPYRFVLLPFLAKLLFPLATMEKDHSLDGQLTNPSIHQLTPPDVELARSMQALQISSCAASNQEWVHEEAVESQFTLLMKVADTQATSSTIPLQAVRADLKRARK